jgi:hypothetical protein
LNKLICIINLILLVFLHKLLSVLHEQSLQVHDFLEQSSQKHLSQEHILGNSLLNICNEDTSIINNNIEEKI